MAIYKPRREALNLGLGHLDPGFITSRTGKNNLHYLSLWVLLFNDSLNRWIYSVMTSKKKKKKKKKDAF